MSTQWQKIKPSDILTKQQQHDLRQRSDLWGAWMIVHAWALIASAAAVYVLLPSFATLVVAVLIIGGRQLGLSILMHEGSHGLLFKTRWMNENITKWFAAWPMIISLGEYRVRHMKHHRFTRTDQDPENYLYTPFPVTKDSMLRKALRDLTGIAFLRTTVGLFSIVKERAGWSGVKAFYGGPLIANLILFGISLLAGRPDLYFLMWLLPMATTQMFFLRIRNIAEHAAVEDLEDPLKNTRTTIANPVERMFFAPYYVNYHIEHHLVPFVPCYRLRKVHDLLLEQGYGARMDIQKGYRRIIALNSAA